MRANGFTLLEVLLATTVLGVVMAMLALSLSATLRVVEATEKQEEVYHLAQIAMRRITEDLAATVATADGIFVGQKKELHERRVDSLVFTSQAHLVLNPEKQKPGVATIRYQLQEDPDDERKLKLLRSDISVLPGVDPAKELSKDEVSETAFLLADTLRAVQFSYFNQDGHEFDSWQRRSSSGEREEAGKLPAAVHCTLEFWVDLDKKISQSFSTSVLVPAEVQDEQ
jgi:general secretion pathway protein J